MLCRVVCLLLLVAWTGEWPLERDPVLYYGLWRSPLEVFGPLFVSVPGLNLFPWQILLLACMPFGMFRPGAFRGRSWTLDAAIATSLLSVGLTFLWGWMRGGDAYQAYYQLWRFLTALLVGLLLNSVIVRPRDLRALGMTVLVAALVRGILAEYFYWGIVKDRIDPPPPYMTNHDDSLLFVSGILVVITWALARGGRVAWAVVVVVVPHLLYAIVLNDRRLAWIELVLAFGLLYFLLPRDGWRRRVNRWLPLLAPAVLAYVAVGWGREGAVFAPIQALSTAGSVQDSSSLARQEEVRNLLYTLSTASNPLLGTGWGVAYSQVTGVYTHFEKGFWQYAYLPHNSLLGVVVFSGFVGLFGIWLVVPVTAMLAKRGHQGAGRPVEMAAAMAVLCFLPGYGVQCYGDIGFQSFTGSLLLGVAMGTAGKVSVWAEESARALPRHSRRSGGTIAPPGR